MATNQQKHVTIVNTGIISNIGRSNMTEAFTEHHFLAIKWMKEVIKENRD